MSGQYIEMVFPDYDIPYIAVRDNADTFKSENELILFYAVPALDRCFYVQELNKFAILIILLFKIAGNISWFSGCMPYK